MVDINDLLSKVEKPGRYIGNELNSCIKDKSAVKLRFAFTFPDLYEIGMSNLGVQVLYGALNKEKDIWCERVYAPWTDMEKLMRDNGIPLFALESKDPVSGFDILAFTLQYELAYSNVLNLLSLAGIPLLARDRDESYPIVIGGGPCAFNPEPLAEIFDAFSVGEGEEALVEFSRLMIKMKDEGTYTKESFLREASHLEGFYVPSLYDVEFDNEGRETSFAPKYADVPSVVRKSVCKRFDSLDYIPLDPIVPYVESVQNRITVELSRGCIRGCRFCQAGHVTRPLRERSPETVNAAAREIFKNTGYSEVSMCCLSTSDYSDVDRLCDLLLEWTKDRYVSLSLPSLRADSFTAELMEKTGCVRSSGLTFAPEAGTQRLRDIINKRLTEDDLMNAVDIAFRAQKTSVKLYFMNGLPLESDEDILGIADLAAKVIQKFYSIETRNRNRAPQVTISVACFVPKPFTPFQWEPQNTISEFERKQLLLKDAVRSNRKIRYNYHSADVSYLEAVFARGSRRLTPVLIKAFKKGAKFDAWSESFDFGLWMDCFRECGIDPDFYSLREIPESELLPWDFIDCGVTKSFLLRERHKAHDGLASRNCREGCNGCGSERFGECMCRK